MDVPVTEIAVVGEVLSLSACADVACVGEEVIVEDQVVMIDDGSIHFIADIGFQEEVIDDSQVEEEPVVEINGEVQIRAPSVSEEVELVENPADQCVEQAQALTQEEQTERSEVIPDMMEHAYTAAGEAEGEFVPGEVVEETVDNSVHLSPDEQMPQEILQPESTADKEDINMETADEDGVTMETAAEASPREALQKESTEDEEQEKKNELVEIEKETEEAMVDSTTEDLDNGKVQQDMTCPESFSDEMLKKELNGESQQEMKPESVSFENPFESCGDGSNQNNCLVELSDNKTPDITVKAAEFTNPDSVSDGMNSMENIENEISPPKVQVPILESDRQQHNSMSSKMESSRAGEAHELPKKRWKRRHASTEAKQSVDNASSDGQASPGESTPQEKIEQPVPSQPIISPQKRGRGRPRKSVDAKSGIPSAESAVNSLSEKKIEDSSVPEPEMAVSPVRKRGRRRKSSSVNEKATEDISKIKSDIEESKVVRGRQARSSITQQATTNSDLADGDSREMAEKTAPNKTTLLQIAQQPRLLTEQVTQKIEENFTAERTVIMVTPARKRGRPRKKSSGNEKAAENMEESTVVRERQDRQQVSTDSDHNIAVVSETTEPNITTPLLVTQQQTRDSQSEESESKPETRNQSRKRKKSEDSTVVSACSTRGQVSGHLKRSRRETNEDGESEEKKMKSAESIFSQPTSSKPDSGLDDNTTNMESNQRDSDSTKKPPVKRSEPDSVAGMFAKIAEQAAKVGAMGEGSDRVRRLRTRTEPSSVEIKSQNENPPPPPPSKPKVDRASRKQTNRQRTKSVPHMVKQNRHKSTKKRTNVQQKENIEQELTPKQLSPDLADQRPCYMKVIDQLNTRSSGFKSKPGRLFVSGTYICDECNFHTTRLNLIIQHYKDHFRSPSPVAKKKLLSSTSGRGRGKPKTENGQSTFESSIPSFDLDEDDSVDLPAVFTETPIKGGLPHVKGDLVWVKIKRLPFWPAVVKNVYLERKRLKKISVKFIGEFAQVDPRRGYCLSYNKRTCVPFAESHCQHARLKEEGEESEHREYFVDAVTKAEDFVRKKVLGLPLDSFEFFDDGMSDIEVDSCEGNPLDPALGVNMEGLSDVSEISMGAEEENRDFAGSGFASSEEEIDQNSNLSEAQKERKAKMRAKQEKLVEYIKTENTKNYLYAVYQGGKSSDLHNLYQTGGEARRHLRFSSSYGPIDDPDLEDEIFMALKCYFQNLFNTRNYDVHYILDVWTPEAIVYAMMKTNKYSRKKAWEIFQRGVRKTKAEREQEHTELLQSAAKIDEESKARYDFSFEQNLKFAKQSLNFSD